MIPPPAPAPAPSPARRRTALGSAVVLATSATAVALGAGGPAAADTLVVTTCADDGTGSLRQAIADAETAAGPDTIVFSLATPCTGPTAVPVGSTMSITQSLTIAGPGADSFVLDGGGSSRITGMLVVSGDGTTDFSLSGVTVTRSVANESAVTALNVDTVTVTGVDFVDNESAYEGGGLTVDTASGAVTVSGSNFTDNRSTGGTDEGGGFFGTGLAGPVAVLSSLFTANEAYRGAAVGIVSSTGDLVVANSTFSGNIGDSTGALYFDGTGSATVLFTTVADNDAYSGTGGFYFVTSASTLEIVGSVFAGNANGQVSAGGRTVTSSDNIFHGTVAGFTPDPTDLDVDPQLGPLADNGGPTLTRALTPTSPAVGHGPAVVPTFPGNDADQRGAPYLRVYGGRADAGAYELQPEPVPDPGPVPEPRFTG